MTFEEFHMSHLSMDGYSQYTAEDAWQASRRAALEEAACMLEAESDEANEWGYERFARYTKEAAMKVRALSQKDPQ